MAKNSLNRKQARQVEDWLLDKTVWADIEKRRLSKEDAATLATTALSFTVTAANIDSCVDVVGRKWPSTATRKSKAAYQTIVLKAAVKHLYQSAGVPAPTEAVARTLGLPWPPADEQAPQGDTTEPLLPLEVAGRSS